ncbi:unnamed protein product [Auanema sp. JU1783]|nr:unnamed protein product [Auanema sp. JU1783]
MRLYRGQKIAQILLNREEEGLRHLIADRIHWYAPNESLLCEEVWNAFHLSFLDVDTQNFLDSSTATSESYCLQAFYSFMTLILSTIFSKTSINGVLNRGGMFLFSTNQLNEFLGVTNEWDRAGKTLLDLGAGDGGITQIYSNLFENIYATEMSKTMQFRLMAKGFNIEDVHDWPSGKRKYDLISALNLLDRHYNPEKLLKDLHQLAFRSKCPVLLGIVLPLKQYVEFHPSTRTHKPDVYLKVRGYTFEDHLQSLLSDILRPAGFELMKWTKLPYLCEGDFNKPYYVLYDAVLLLRALPTQDVYSDFLNDAEIIHEEL